MRVAEDADAPRGSRDDRRPRQHAPKSEGAAPSSRLIVLYAEDNPGDVRLVECLIEGEGEHIIDLEFADRLQVALTMLKTSRVDILLLDLSLPDSNGIETIVEATRAAPEVPIVVLTSFNDTELGIRALRAGARDFLSKKDLSGELLVRTLKLAAERAQLESKLRESERRYALAAAGSNDGLWDWDLGTNHVFYSARWKSLVGCEEAEVGKSPEEMLARVHPDDQATLRAAIEMLRGGRSRTFECEHRMRVKDGSWRWMLCRAAAASDSQSKCVRMAGSLTDITGRKETEEELRRGAFYDSLTKLPNRALFLDRLQQCVLRSRRHAPVGYAVLFVDLDRFKWINDSFGHHAGDQLLIEVAHRLEGCVRPCDTVARLGGDEFTVLLGEIRHEHHVFHVAERILAALAAPAWIEGQEVTACASIGIALGPATYVDPGQVLRDAGIAMHQAKKAGKGRYAVFEARMHEEAVLMMRLEADLRRALDQRQFRLHYQPIVSLRTGHIASFEALLRWQHPVHGLLYPDSFLPLAEETGAICRIGGWVLNQACHSAARWQAEGGHDSVGMHVNLSAREFRAPSLEGTLRMTLVESALKPASLHLEITEGIAMEGAEDRPLLRRLRAQGVNLDIDDFGTGYSSLAALHLIPVACLKIDKRFVRGVESKGKNAEVVQAIVGMANSLGLETIAEGVETKAQLEAVRQMGCGYGQGYLFSRPVPEDDAHRLLLLKRNRFGRKSPSA